MTELRRRGLVSLFLTLTVLATYLGWLLWPAHDPAGEPLTLHLLQNATVLGAVVLAWQARRRARARVRRGLTVLALALSAQLLGNLAWSVLELRGGAVPYLSVADAFYLLMYPLLAAAFQALAPLPRRTLPRLRLALDSLIAVGGLATLMWWGMLHTHFGAGMSGTELLRGVLSLLYPLLSLGLLALLLAVLLQGRRLPAPLLTLALGVVVLAGAELGFSWLGSADAYRTGHPVDGLYALGAVLWALGAWLTAKQDRQHPPDRMTVPPPLRRVLAVAPYVVVSGLSVLLLWLPVTGDLRGRGVLVGVVLTMLMVVARQGVAFAERERLTHKLRRANGELERANADLERSRRQLAHQARHDALTGLPNRLNFEELLRRALRPGTFGQLEPFAVMFLDLDGFKEVNDTFGHAVGDELLVQVAARLRGNLRTGDLVARQGGDEFLVLLRPASAAEALVTGRRLLASLSEPVAVRGHAMHISASIGVSLFPLHSRDAAELCRRADLAMYQAKDLGKNALRIHGQNGFERGGFESGAALRQSGAGLSGQER